MVVRRDEVAVQLPSSNARANSAALPKRSAGSFWRAVAIASSRLTGVVFRSFPIGVGSSVITLATIAWAVGPVNGGSPASISCSTHPSA